ncbi:hypothetical protein CRE_00655 [Caenorhabditis remanei]|uniref:Uncharacterized protein n=1 Tax=Caenorhabditis remanei TaxID=31234 RepID=E3LDN6_CAERE|nr:hypothetical protein CRE_00655 [Caenorhabditis remanei]
MDTPFPFLKLPENVMAKVMIEIDPVQILIFALKFHAVREAMIKNKILFKIKSVKWVLSDDTIASLVIEMEGRKIYIRVDADENFDERHQNRNEQMPLKSVSLKDIPENDLDWHMRVTNISEVLASAEEEVENPAELIDLQMVGVHGMNNLSKLQRLEILSKVLMSITEVDSFYLATFISGKMNLLDFFNWKVTEEMCTWETPKAFREVQFYPTPSADRRQLLREFAYVQRNVTVEYSQLLVTYPMQGTKFGEPLTSRISIIMDSDFITLKSLLNSTCEEIHIVYETLNGFVMNAVVRKWISGELNNLKVFVGQTFNSFINRESVFDKLNPIAPTSSAHPKFEPMDGDWDEARDVFRPRGSMRATIVLQEKHFKLIIW